MKKIFHQYDKVIRVVVSYRLVFMD